jgi:hypothetical protein
MRVVLETDEAWSIMTLIVAQVLDGVAFTDDGRAAVRQWRSGRAGGTEPMHQLAEEMNEALGTLVDEQTRRLIRRKGRFVHSSEA